MNITLFNFLSMKSESETINNIIHQNGSNIITDEKFIELEIQRFKVSKRRKEMIDGEKYYEYESKCDRYSSVLIPADDIDLCAEYMAEYFSKHEKLDMIEAAGEIVWLPISMYEHSGISIWLGGKDGHVDARWDCSTIGFAYVEKCTAEKEGALRADKNGLYNGRKSWQEWAYDMMEREMETYNLFVTGEVFGYMVEGGDGYCDDSCWGFYGTDEIPRMIEQAKVEIDWALERQAKERESNMAVLIQHIDELIGETWMFGDVSYRIGTDLFGQGCMECAQIRQGRVGCYVPCQVNSLDFETLDIIAKYINKTVA